MAESALSFSAINAAGVVQHNMGLFVTAVQGGSGRARCDGDIVALPFAVQAIMRRDIAILLRLMVWDSHTDPSGASLKPSGDACWL